MFVEASIPGSVVPNFRKSNILIIRPINSQAFFQTSGNNHTRRSIVKMEESERGTAVSKKNRMV